MYNVTWLNCQTCTSSVVRPILVSHRGCGYSMWSCLIWIQKFWQHIPTFQTYPVYHDVGWQQLPHHYHILFTFYSYRSKHGFACLIIQSVFDYDFPMPLRPERINAGFRWRDYSSQNVLHRHFSTNAIVVSHHANKWLIVDIVVCSSVR